MEPILHVVGLTGGIASGKSAVGEMIRNAGIPVLDADSLGHMVLEPDGAAYGAVIEEFGTGILGVDGQAIDRQKLGGLVFDSAEKRRKLEAITHPAIGALAARAMQLIAERGETLAVYEAALLVETGIYKGMAALLVVSCSLENQLARLCERDKISRAAAAVRIASQLPTEEKAAVADYIVQNDGTYAALEDAVNKVIGKLKNRFQ